MLHVSCCTFVLLLKKKSTKINFLGLETAQWSGGLQREGAGVEEFDPSLESSFPLSLSLSLSFGKTLPWRRFPH